MYFNLPYIRTRLPPLTIHFYLLLPATPVPPVECSPSVPCPCPVPVAPLNFIGTCIRCVLFSRHWFSSLCFPPYYRFSIRLFCFHFCREHLSSSLYWFSPAVPYTFCGACKLVTFFFLTAQITFLPSDFTHLRYSSTPNWFQLRIFSTVLQLVISLPPLKLPSDLQTSLGFR